MTSAGNTEQQDSARTNVNAVDSWSQSAATERLQGIEIAELIERLVAAMKLQQAILFERAVFQFPKHIGREATMPDERQAERGLGFKSGQSRSGVEHRI